MESPSCSKFTESSDTIASYKRHHSVTSSVCVCTRASPDPLLFWNTQSLSLVRWCDPGKFSESQYFSSVNKHWFLPTEWERVTTQHCVIEYFTRQQWTSIKWFLTITWLVMCFSPSPSIQSMSRENKTARLVPVACGVILADRQRIIQKSRN